jgi:hypothetical protein
MAEQFQAQAQARNSFPQSSSMEPVNAPPATPFLEGFRCDFDARKIKPTENF